MPFPSCLVKPLLGYAHPYAVHPEMSDLGKPFC